MEINNTQFTNIDDFDNIKPASFILLDKIFYLIRDKIFQQPKNEKPDFQGLKQEKINFDNLKNQLLKLLKKTLKTNYIINKNLH